MKRGGYAVLALVPLLAIPSALVGQEHDSTTTFVYTRPQPFRAVTGIPKTLGITARETFRARNVPMMLVVTTSTLALIAIDEPVLHESRRLAWRLGLPPNHPSANVRLGPFKMAFPTTVGSGLYFIGDGLTSVGLASAFAARGALANDMRARRTASEVIRFSRQARWRRRSSTSPDDRRRRRRRCRAAGGGRFPTSETTARTFRRTTRFRPAT